MNEKIYKIQQLIEDPSFVQWATGESEGKRAEEWNEWVKRSEENRKTALRAQKEITGIRFTSPQLPEVTKEWERVSNKIREKQSNKLFSGKSLIYHKDKERLVGYLYKVAAVLLVCAFVGFFVYTHQGTEPQEVQAKTETVTVTTEYGQKKIMELSEGSKVILAPASKLTYKLNEINQSVERVILRGEAFFSIANSKSKTRPKFIVETEDGSAAVWGTRFNVNTYGKETQVVLEEGEVRVTSAKESEVRKILKPGEMARFSKSSAGITVNEVNTRVYTSWKTNELYFDDTPFSVLVDSIERTYGINVKVKDPQILETNLSGSIDFISLDGIIEAIHKTLNVTIEKSGKSIIIQQNNN